MQNAILQSKLEFEQQKKNSKKESTQSQGKKKKPKTMSWDQFVESRDNDIKGETCYICFYIYILYNLYILILDEVKVVEHNKDFFDDVVDTLKKEIKKEVVEENRKQRQQKFDEVFSITQLQVI